MLVKPLLVAVLATAGWPFAATADISGLPFVSPMFGNNMVVQRGKPNVVWGWSTPGAAVHVKLGDQEANAIVNTDGRWQVQITPPSPGGPYTLDIDGPKHVVFRDILVGDVWLCGGQSNMELPLARVRNGSNEISTANHPEIRFFKVPNHPAYSPAATIQGQWEICSPKTAAKDGLSAVAYFFARRLQVDIHVPMGLVQDCVGGTPAETWTSPESLRPLGDFNDGLAEVERLKAKGGPEYGNYLMHWYDEYDLGLKSNTWAAVDLDDVTWKTVSLSGGFKDLGLPETPAVGWFRREVNLPNPLPAGTAHLHLGVVEKMDTAYINGQWVGASAWVENPRDYALPPGLLQPGKNLIAIRVFKTKPNGGFMSKPETLRLVLGDGSGIALEGEWKGMVSVDARPPHPMPMGFENWPVMPSVLYEGMIQPVAPLALTGAIWYQGEANAGREDQYRKVLPAMIGDWRKLFGQGDFPFYIVSLPAFMAHRDAPGGYDSWAELRAAQEFVSKTVKNTGLAATIDTGEADNIHPKEKQVVGERLAMCALATEYGAQIPYQGPTFKSQEILPGALRINFEHTEGGLLVKGKQLGEFSVAGKDHVWHWAEAKIDGNSVIVASTSVADPQAVRYAWQSNPQATLYNGAGLPAVPFRTDDWTSGKDTGQKLGFSHSESKQTIK